MSFMFKPFRYTDPESVNTPVIPEDIGRLSISGNEAVSKELIKAASVNHALLIDGYVGAVLSSMGTGLMIDKFNWFGAVWFWIASAIVCILICVPLTIHEYKDKK